MDINNKADNDHHRIHQRQSRKTQQQQPLTVYPPCVVSSIHELELYSSSSSDSVQPSGEACRSENIAANSVENGGKTMEVSSDQRQKLSCLSKVSATISWALETAFFKVGLFVGEYPVVVIVAVLIMCGLCGLGMKTFHETEEQEKLWVPQISRLIPEKAWVDRTFPQETRYVTVLAVQKNVLTPEFMNALMDYYMESFHVQVNGRTFRDMCVRAGPFCYVSGLLELWYYNEATIRSLTATDIITTINRTHVSPVSGVDVKTFLGGELTYNNQGVLIAAEATQLTWVLKKELDNSDAAEWEKWVINRALRGHSNISKSYVYATRSFDDEGYGAINSDTKLLTAGFSIVFLFIMLSLGKFNLLEQKIYVSLAGMACVGLAILVAYGVATALDVMYSPIQSIMPFLLLGIGVDDMFVVIETWKNLSPEESKQDVPKKLAMALSRAGVSITVTSVTDIVAFGISATTAIPALSSFCIYATLGILALYILVSTLFSGVLALDERRRKANRDACLCCYKHGMTYTPSKCGSGRSLLHVIFGDFYGPMITKLPAKILIIILAFTTASLGLWRFINMKQDFDLINYIPSDSYAYSFARSRRHYFGYQGVDTTIYCGGLNYFEENDRLQEMLIRISESPYIQKGTINSWFTVFNDFLKQSGMNLTSMEQYHHSLHLFLQSPVGQRFAAFIKQNSTVEPVSIVASYITMKHVLQPDSAHDVSSMEDLRNIIDSSGLPKFEGTGNPEYMCFTYAQDYMSFETNKVLQEELYRNLGMSAAAVFIVTLILIANLWTSLLVFLCVILTMVDVGGALELWGVTIDTASSILLTLSVGLAVDYSAHVGHMFMTVNGTRNNRVIVTLKTIGPAVFNGGFSTFLAFVLLANSSSYGFQLFFRVFFTVVLFGLFHGLAFLPVVLSILGANAYKHAHIIPDSIAMYVGKQDRSNHAPDLTSDQPNSAAHKEMTSYVLNSSRPSLEENDPSKLQIPDVVKVGNNQPIFVIEDHAEIHMQYISCRL